MGWLCCRALPSWFCQGSAGAGASCDGRRRASCAGSSSASQRVLAMGGVSALPCSSHRVWALGAGASAASSASWAGSGRVVATGSATGGATVGFSGGVTVWVAAGAAWAVAMLMRGRLAGWWLSPPAPSRRMRCCLRASPLRHRRFFCRAASGDWW